MQYHTEGECIKDGTWIRVKTDYGTPYIAEVLTGEDSVPPYEAAANLELMLAGPMLKSALVNLWGSFIVKSLSDPRANKAREEFLLYAPEIRAYLEMARKAIDKSEGK